MFSLLKAQCTLNPTVDFILIFTRLADFLGGFSSSRILWRIFGRRLLSDEGEEGRK